MNTAQKKEARKKLLKRDGPTCTYCHREFNENETPTIDHVIPLALGGTSQLENLVLACWRCNHRKAAQVFTIKPDWSKLKLSID